MSAPSAPAPVSLRRRARRRYKSLKRALVFALLRALAALIGALPEGAAWALGRRIGALVHALAGGERRRAHDQLARALPEQDAAVTTRAMFEHLGLTLVELAQLAHAADPGATVERWVELPEASAQAVQGALADAKGRGVIAVSAHLGDWELLPQRIARAGHLVSTVARENANLHLDRWVAALRARSGITTIRRGGGSASAREMLRALKSGHLFALLVDQDTKVQSARVPFFGRLASTPIAAAELALRADRPMIIGFIRRLGPGRHRVTIERVDTAGLEAGEDPVVALTARLTARIEAEVRAVPEQWVWLHQRWRTQDGPRGGRPA